MEPLIPHSQAWRMTTEASATELQGIEALLEFDGGASSMVSAEQDGFDDGDLGFRSPLEGPPFGPGRAFLANGDFLGKRNFQDAQAMQEARAMEIDEGSFLGFDTPISRRSRSRSRSLTF